MVVVVVVGAGGRYHPCLGLPRAAGHKTAVTRRARPSSGLMELFLRKQRREEHVAGQWLLPQLQTNQA